MTPRHQSRWLSGRTTRHPLLSPLSSLLSPHSFIRHRLTIQNKKQRHNLSFLAHGDAEVACYLGEGDGAEDEDEKGDAEPAVPVLPVGDAVADDADGKKDIHGILKGYDEAEKTGSIHKQGAIPEGKKFLRLIVVAEIHAAGGGGVGQGAFLEFGGLGYIQIITTRVLTHII